MTTDATGLSIIVPVLNEADGIVVILERLAPFRERGAEVIVVDGGSNDGTAALAAPMTDRIVQSERGRAIQMNAGARHAVGGRLLFLHADTILPLHADLLIDQALNDKGWGRFDVRIIGRHPLLPMVAFCMNARSRLTGIATGDQAIFMRREVFDSTGGFPVQALMEDIAFCKRARSFGRPACLRAKVDTSGRRWEKHGLWRTIVLMWRLRLAYFFGADPTRLAVEYGYRPPEMK